MFEKPPPEDQEPADKKLKVDIASEEAASATETTPKQTGKPTTDMLGNALTPPPMAAKAPRPLPPKMQPPGIPEGQPLPPTDVPEGSKKTPAPVRPLPEKGRHAPSIDPQKVVKEKFVAPDPPLDPPPYQKGVKVQATEEVFVPRREREDPEFESSSDEEDKDFPSVKPKGYIPASINKLARVGAAAAQAEVDQPLKTPEEMEAEEAMKAEKDAQARGLS